jgi:hypothetical protein
MTLHVSLKIDLHAILQLVLIIIKPYILLQLKLNKKLKVATGLSLSVATYDKIERNRGDIPRSKYIADIIENHLVICQEHSHA